jgi:iron complex outermembrane receptor protein
LFFLSFVKIFAMKIATATFQTWLLMWMAAVPLIAQQTTPDTLTTNELQPITVTAYRIVTTDLATPLSLTVLNKKQLQSGTQQLSLDEALTNLPGVLVQNGTNFAQDVKLSIRGFGARSAFGIRGVRVMVDGFPETTPDGTSQVDAIDPGSLVGVGVIRSGTGGLYGNASGGYINFNTLEFEAKRETELAASIGMFGFKKVQARTSGGKADKFYYSLNGSYTNLDGYRDHSAMKNWLINGGFLIPVSPSFSVRGVITYVNSPVAEDPGALSLEQFEYLPRQAREPNVLNDAEEAIRQFRTGVALTKTIGQKHSLQASFYQSARDFQAFLPYDYVDLQRIFSGGNFSYNFKSKPRKINWEFKLGLDLASQTDDRKRFENNQGQKGLIYANQTERFSSVGYYLIQKIQLGSHLSLLPALRLDFQHASVDDHYLHDLRVDTFQQQFKVFNPSLGLELMVLPTLHFYLNGSRNYDVPTILEISQPRDFSGETFNRSLKPEHNISAEIGTKFLAFNGRMRTELAFYRIWLRDEIIQFSGWEIPAHYENAGKSNRKGVELASAIQFTNRLLVRLTYTYADFRFKEYKPYFYEGNRLPGVPRHMGGVALEYFNPNALTFTIGSQKVGSIYTNNDNEDKTKPYNNLYFRAEYQITHKKIGTALFLGLNNLLNQKYAANIRINSGDNAYEPAPPRNFYIGFKIKF